MTAGDKRSHPGSSHPGSGDRPDDTDATESSAAGGALPEIDFSTFIVSLGTSAMVHLGLAPDPDGRTHRNLTLAQQTIDILGMLQHKTRGNLDADESSLLEGLLYDLRMRYLGCR